VAGRHWKRAGVPSHKRRDVGESGLEVSG